MTKPCRLTRQIDDFLLFKDIHESSTCHSSGHLAILKASIVKNIGFFGLSVLYLTKLVTFHNTFEKVDFLKIFLRKPVAHEILARQPLPCLCFAFPGRARKSAWNSQKSSESHHKLVSRQNSALSRYLQLLGLKNVSGGHDLPNFKINQIEDIWT